MRTRALILEGAGHKVTNVQGLANLREVCARGKYEVVVIGQALNDSDKKDAFAIVRELCSNARVLELFGQTPVLSAADEWLQIPAAAAGELADRVMALISRGPR